ncbi:MAG: ribosome biogenesis GTPase YlqF [Lachnospiraceae bacterium]|nr:ribosome biogenesis GTPase YlqF [Lachnospiraceae bacterium]
MEFQWYPGHMTKAIRQMREDIKIIDLVIELIDARIPLSSRNPDIDQLGQGKARIVLLNKRDLSDDAVTKQWISYFEEKGYVAIAIDARDKKSAKLVDGAVEKACKAKRERDAKRGIKNRPIRAMVVGIPNIGKSTFINSYAGKAATKTGNKPGVTKGKQWIRLRKDLELLDTPGILWPKFEDQTVGFYLAAIGAIRAEVIQTDEMALEVVKLLRQLYPGRISEKYEVDETKEPVQVMNDIAINRKCVKSGGDVDFTKAATLFLDDFKNGRLGKISIERPMD